MTYLTLSIEEDTPEARNIEALAEAEQVSREEAALKLLASSSLTKTSKASPAARRIIGAFKEDAALMDETLELAMEDRQRRNSAPPHG